VEQLTEGVLSRLLLVGIDGGTPSERADLSRALARRLEDGGLFISVRNGDAAVLARDREILFSNRYLLSPAVSPERFSSTGLRTAVEASIDLLASPAGMMLKGLLGHDPTGEMIEMIGTLDTGGSPASQHGAWASRDGRRAILMLQTRAAGSDTDAQAAALARIHPDFAELPKASPDTRLLLSGAAVFAVNSRAAIESEAVRLTTISTAAVICLLLLIYRSVTAVVLGLLPVATGALAGIAAVALGFGSVHGLTIGFGTTLIGEAVDYTIYYFVQSDGEDGEGRWMERFWPTIRLGVLTSVFGFASLLFSGFPGLAQLGLYSIAGLVTAAAVTRFVLPHLRPTSFHIRDIAPLGRAMAGFWGQLSRLRLAIPLLAIAASVVLVTHRDQIWSSGLSGLSPVSSADQARPALPGGSQGRQPGSRPARRRTGRHAPHHAGRSRRPRRLREPRPLPAQRSHPARPPAIPAGARRTRPPPRHRPGRPAPAGRQARRLSRRRRRRPPPTPADTRIPARLDPRPGGRLPAARTPAGLDGADAAARPGRRHAPRSSPHPGRAGRQRGPLRGHFRRIQPPLSGLPGRSHPAVPGRLPGHRAAHGGDPAPARAPDPGTHPAGRHRTDRDGRPGPHRPAPDPAAPDRHAADCRRRLQLRPVLRPGRQQSGG
ncbi:MAG: MMPL family transporter, partial [Zoogloea sp.]|nr:MMPL family transporter [Zoogloea sp.]